MKIHQPIIVTVSYPNMDTARMQAEQLIEKKLIACAQFTNIESMYRWQNQVQQSQEVLLQAKTIQSLWQDILSAIKSTHPYEVPEIIATPVIEIDQAYLSWMLGELGISGQQIHA